jgi:DNA-binding NarL/FixJ family response regulator
MATISSIEAVTIIHCDDEALLTEGLARAFKAHFPTANLISYNDPQLCLDKTDYSKSINVIISDYQMPGMDGVSLVRAMIKKVADAGKTKPALLVLFSAYDQEVKERHADMTFDLMISKPTKSKEIIDQIKSTLNMYGKYTGEKK